MTDPVALREKYQLSTVVVVGLAGLAIGGVLGVPIGRSTVSDGYHSVSGVVASVSEDGSVICLATQNTGEQCFSNGLGGPAPEVGVAVEALFAFVPVDVEKYDRDPRMVAWERAPTGS